MKMARMIENVKNSTDSKLTFPVMSANSSKSWTDSKFYYVKSFFKCRGINLIAKSQNVFIAEWSLKCQMIKKGKKLSS